MLNRTTLGDILRYGLSSPSFILGGTISLSFIIMAAMALFWTPYDYEALAIAERLHPPSWIHWLGTDHFGRDILSMIMKGSHNSIMVALVAVSIGMTVGIPLGALAAAYKGWFGESLMRMNDFVFAFPALLSAIMITALWGPGTINAIIAIGIFNIPVFARVTRAGALIVWQHDFILAARLTGKSTFRIINEHVITNIISILIVQGTIQFALAILAEAGLSYLGLGTQPPTPSWGKMLYEGQTMMYQGASYVVIFPGLAIALSVFGLNLFGDGLRDVLDPKLRRIG